VDVVGAGHPLVPGPALKSEVPAFKHGSSNTRTS